MDISKIEAHYAELEEGARSALRTLLFDQGSCRGIRRADDTLWLPVEYCESYDLTLVLTGAEGFPDGYHCCGFDPDSFRRDGDTYSLCSEAANDEDEDDTFVPFTLRFHGARAEISVYRADVQGFFSTPWKHLCSIAGAILDKTALPGDHLNEKEKALLPLIAELSKLTYWTQIPEEYASCGLPLLKDRIRRHGFTELLPLVEKLEASLPNEKETRKRVMKLTARLDQTKYEPLWRELYGLLSDSQADYPAKADICVPGGVLTQTRQEIQRLMRAHGYSGTYPDFEKRGALRGIRLARSYAMDYFIAGEKNAVFRIHCTETCCDGALMIEFLCGTELLRKNEAPGDIFSCTFNAKGRRLFQTVPYETAAPETLAQRVEIAVKRAELQKLTKEERLALYGYTGGFWSIFFGFLIVGGGLFAVFMTLGMMLLCAAITSLFLGFGAIGDMMAQMPWWELFALAWGLFGGAMGIVTALAGRK